MAPFGSPPTARGSPLWDHWILGIHKKSSQEPGILTGNPGDPKLSHIILYIYCIYTVYILYIYCIYIYIYTYTVYVYEYGSKIKLIKLYETTDFSIHVSFFQHLFLLGVPNSDPYPYGIYHVAQLDGWSSGEHQNKWWMIIPLKRV